MIIQISDRDLEYVRKWLDVNNGPTGRCTDRTCTECPMISVARKIIEKDRKRKNDKCTIRVS